MHWKTCIQSNHHESIFLLVVLTKLLVFQCTAMSTIFLEASRILMYDNTYNISRNSEYSDVQRCLPKLQGFWSCRSSSLKRSQQTFSPNLCAIKPLAHRERMILISSFAFDEKLCHRWKAIGKFIFQF